METSKKTLNNKCRFKKFLNNSADRLLTVAARASAHSGDKLKIYLSLFKRDKKTLCILAYMVLFSAPLSFLYK